MEEVSLLLHREFSFTHGAVSLAALTDHVKYKKDMNCVPSRQQSAGNETRAPVRQVNWVWPFSRKIMASNAILRQPRSANFITDKFIAVIYFGNCTIIGLKS